MLILDTKRIDPVQVRVFAKVNILNLLIDPHPHLKSSFAKLQLGYFRYILGYGIC